MCMYGPTELLFLLSEPVIYLYSTTGVWWPSGTVPDLRPQGHGFESHPWLLCTNANSAGLVNEYQRKLGSKRAYHVMHQMWLCGLGWCPAEGY